MTTHVGRPRIAVFVSGGGTNLQALLDACKAETVAADIVLVVSNTADAYALERAKLSGVPSVVLERGELDRASYDARLVDIVSEKKVDLVVLAGWNRLLSTVFLAGRIVMNLHPSLPGVFAGLGGIKNSYDAWKRNEVETGGVMVHYVPDEGVDDGPVIGSEPVGFQADDTLESFEKRVHAVEHELLVRCVQKVVVEKFSGGDET